MNEPADLPLPESAREAWNAYLQMEETKRAHFSLLEELEDREHHRAGSRTLAERTHLEQLLRLHDEQVGRFRSAMRRLSERDADAHRCLIEHITAHNARLGADGEVH